jgi:hypothetical protein
MDKKVFITLAPDDHLELTKESVNTIYFITELEVMQSNIYFCKMVYSKLVLHEPNDVITTLSDKVFC